MKRFLFIIIGMVFLLLFSMKPIMAIDPPKDEASIAYNYFSGGGITVQGPAIILKKEMMGRMSIEAGARTDMVSSASIDVVTQGSKFSDERKEIYLGGSHIWGDSLFSGTYSVSDESDYTSNTFSLGLTHDFLDRNVTVNLGVARSRDDVSSNSNPSFGEKAFNRTAYRIGLTQSFSPRWLAQLNYEITADDGYINSPYRSALVGNTVQTAAQSPELYPNARTGQAWVIRSTHGFLRDLALGGGLKSSVQVSYRYYQDTFDVQSHTGKLYYQYRLSPNKRFGISYRYYQQTAASFYGDVLPSSQLFKARDKELSTYSSHGVGFSFRFEPHQKKWGWFKNPYLKAGYNFLMFKYDDFSDPRSGQLYSWEANVFQISLGSTY